MKNIEQTPSSDRSESARLFRIYALHSGDLRYRYVGQTSVSVQLRLKRHRDKVAEGSSAPVHTWMRSVGPTNVCIIELEVCDENNADNREVFWVTSLLDIGHDLMNATHGGRFRNTYREGFTPPQCTPEYWEDPTIHKQHSQKTTDRWKSPEFADIAKKSMKDAWDQDDGVRRDAASFRGRQISHRRYHVNRDVKKDWCIFCTNDIVSEDQAKLTPSRNQSYVYKGKKSQHVRWHLNRNTTHPDCVFCFPPGAESNTS